MILFSCFLTKHTVILAIPRSIYIAAAHVIHYVSDGLMQIVDILGKCDHTKKYCTSSKKL